MDSLELLSQQINQYLQQTQSQFKEYQKQNEEDHKILNEKIDTLLDQSRKIQAHEKVNDARFDKLEQGQEELKSELDSVQDQLKDLQDQSLKRQHGWKLLAQVLAGVGTLIAIAVGIWKLGLFS